MHSKSIIELLQGVQETMNLVNEKMTEEVMSKMSEQQLELLQEARSKTSKSELKKMTDKLVDLNEKMKNNAT